MVKIFLLSVAAIICFVVASLIRTPKHLKQDSKPNRLKKKPIIKMLNRDGDIHDDEWHTYIAGAQHHISKYDIGGFSGWVEADYDNKYDRNAMGVYNSFGKLLGYIPAKEVSDYCAWCDAQPQPCVGFIFVEDGEMRGRVKILRPCNEDFLKNEFTRYLQWVKDNYGDQYLPKNMSMDFEVEN